MMNAKENAACAAESPEVVVEKIRTVDWHGHCLITLVIASTTNATRAEACTPSAHQIATS
jgi:hypothetical protein